MLTISTKIRGPIVSKKQSPNSRTKILVTRVKRYANPRGEISSREM